MKLSILPLILLLNLPATQKPMSTIASASYTGEFFKLKTHQQFGEMADPFVEEQMVNEFEVQGFVSLKKIGVDFEKKILEVVKKLKIRPLPFKEELSSANQVNHTFHVRTTHMKYNHLNIPGLYITMSLNQTATEAQEEFFIKEMEGILQKTFRYSRLEMKFLEKKTYAFENNLLIPNKSSDYDLPVFDFYKDYSFRTYTNPNVEPNGVDFPEENQLLITGAWEITGKNELILYYPDYASPIFNDDGFFTRMFNIEKNRGELLIKEPE